MAGKQTLIIPVPTWALDDDQLIALHDRIQEVELECDDGDERDVPCAGARSAACIAAIRQELEWRGRTFRLGPNGEITTD